MKTHNKLYKLPSPWERGWGRGLITLCILLLLTATSCKKDKNQPRYETNVYVAGSVDGQAMYWKNGEAVVLPNISGGGVWVNSIYVANGDVYVVGGEESMTGIDAILWKNGVPEKLPSSSGDEAFSVYVDGTDVYVAGAAKYWKNRTVHELPDGSAFADPGDRSICVSGGDVYVAGTRSTGSGNMAKYWKNGVSKDLTNGNSRAIYASGSDVYVLVNVYADSRNMSTVWKNDEMLYDLTGGIRNTYTYSIYVSNGNVYVAGHEIPGSVFVATVWKNDEMMPALTDGSRYAEAYSVYVLDGDVYAAGGENDGDNQVAKYWKNGEAVILAEGTEAKANSIMVVKEEVRQ